ncbi:GGDEF domain-containing protein [Aestuariirhabdus sp. Z084]|uniref:GGDEF domain-containing protein n=1 Tax=Aestuariirhabdus haliotis TaxID=2918751 RepID=UPI00201B379B|nr:GGDEF domain-containing protein [Aestuariirhabdus haliotis]MCL6414849.1 GGDEF domain-containing protein [Aestuariirhabdus haliotis]MCL6418781.1 GGDEF domain-containing protein [Aestuariirhabdus haliotis]
MSSIREMHWLMDMITHINVGLVVFDRQGKVHVWNHFMENHSGVSSSQIKQVDSLFDRFPIFRETWLQKKLDAVLVLESEIFISSEQVPHLFDFPAYRPVTGQLEMMYQNVSLNVLKQPSGEADLISMMIYDVTDIAANRLALQKANLELSNLSRTDRLTGLFNRGYWQEQLISMVSLHNRYQNSCCLLMFDIDHFKQVNDTYGHLAGDMVIKQVAATSLSIMRSNDIVGRYGGEEFAIILPETDIEGALLFADRLRRAIAGQVIRFENKDLSVSVSLGVVPLEGADLSPEQCISAADAALYEAKKSGRNCVKSGSLLQD